MDSQFTGQQRWLRRSGLLMAVWLAACGGIEGDGSRVSPALLAVQVGGGENGGSILPPVEGEFPSLLPGVGANLPQDEPVSGLSSFENESARSFTVSGASTASPMRPRSLAQAPSVSMINLGTLPAGEAQQLEEDGAKPGSDGVQKRLRTGVGRKLSGQGQVSSSSTGGSLHWQTLADGSRVAAMGVSTAGARSVRLGLLIDALPAQARLRFYAPGATQMIELPAKQVLARLEAKRHGAVLQGAGVFWAPAVAGSSAVVEVVLPAGADTAAVTLDIDEVMHQAISAADTQQRRVSGNLSGSCQIDFVCTPPRAEEAVPADASLFLDSVEYDTLGRAWSFSCSGMLIGDSGQTGAPYVLTADHCIGDRTQAFDTDAYLFWRSTICQADALDPRLALFAWGLEYLYSETYPRGTDVALLRPANHNYHVPAAGLALAGWDAATQGSPQVVGLHHPGGDHLMRSVGLAGPASSRNYLRVFWNPNQGTTEGGSSGSALLKDGMVIGTLWGGSSACGVGILPNGQQVDLSRLPDEYGRFSVAYARGLRNWLNTNTRPLAFVARTGHDAGPAELIFSDLRASPAGRTVYQAARLNANVDGLAAGNPWRTPLAPAALEYGAARVVAVKDVDGDERDDVVLRRPGAFGTDYFSVLQEREDEGVNTPGQWILHDRVAPSTVVLGLTDMDGNGVADLVLYDARLKLIDVVLLSLDGSGNYLRRPIRFYGLVDDWRTQRPIASLSPIAVGDFEGLGRGQILLRDSRFPRDPILVRLPVPLPDAPAEPLWDETQAVRHPSTVAMPRGLTSVVDVNGDGRDDFLFNDRGRVSYMLSQGSYSLAAPQAALAATPAGFALAAVKDADGDGLPDLLLRNRTSGEVRIARNPGGLGAWSLQTVALTQAP